MSAHDAHSTSISAALSSLLEEAKRWNKADQERRHKNEWNRFEWDCVTREDALRDDFVKQRSEWAEAAYSGDWEKLFRLAYQAQFPSSPTKLINTTRLQRTKNITSGGERPLSGFTALHQAAWHGAPVEVVQGLIDLGAYRWMRTTDGKSHLPVDVARLRGHSHLYDVLEPPNYLPEWTQEDLKSIERHFHEVIEERTNWITERGNIRLPNLDVLREIKGKMYMSVPGMYGGFGFQLEGGHLVADSSCRVWGGSGVTHHITPLGVTIASEGWG